MNMIIPDTAKPIEITMDTVLSYACMKNEAQLSFMQYDLNSRFLKVHLTQNNNPITLTSNNTVRVNYTKPDGLPVFNDAEIDLTENVAYVELTEQMLIVPTTITKALLQIQIYEMKVVGTKTVNSLMGTSVAKVTINPSPNKPDDVTSTYEFNALSQGIANLDNALIAETIRATSENTRNTNEATRVTHENTRISAESSRVSADSTRTTNENTRKSNETTRVSSEGGRVSAESSRVSAESSRVSAESARVIAENARAAVDYNGFDARITQNKTNTAPLYSGSSTYTLGKYCTYNNIMYRCTTAITVAEAWNVAHWTVANVGDELSNKVNNSRVLTDVPVNAKFTDTTYSDATTSVHGLMSTTDKTKVDNMGNICKITTGDVSSLGSSTWKSFAITYGVTYSTIPFVNILPTSGFATENIKLDSITATGMTFSIFAQSTDFTYSAKWFAIGNI